MKKYLSIAILIAIITSCNLFKKRDISPITSTVYEVENIVKKQDKIVQSSIESEKFDYIIPSSNIAIDSIKVKLNILENLTVKEDELAIKTEAIKYINSMVAIIESLKDYSTLTDSTSLFEAEAIDKLNYKAIDSADSCYQKYAKAINSLGQ